MSCIKWSELFPTKFSTFIFIAYIALFINQGILVTASQNSDKKYNYNTTLVVLMTEATKLIISAILYCKKENFGSLVTNIRENTNLLGLYFVPSLLYCIYNNLAFINLTAFDPTTYYMLLQLRVVMTAFLFQLIFKKYLTKRQWIALAMLTIGCMIKHVDIDSNRTPTTTHNTDQEDFDSDEMLSDPEDAPYRQMTFGIGALALVLLQSACSSLAGVYNEYLLKGGSRGLAVDVLVQNAFMYFDSIVCNLLFVVVVVSSRSEAQGSSDASSSPSLLRADVLLIVLNAALGGVATSFFLKTLDSILKTFASALELALAAVACYLIFGTAINHATALSICVVSASIVVYSQNPVDNRPKVSAADELRLMEEDGYAEE